MSLAGVRERDKGWEENSGSPFPADSVTASLSTTHPVILVPAATEHGYAAIVAAALLEAAGEGDTDSNGLALRVAGPDTVLEETAQHVVVAPSTARGLADASAMITTWRPHLPQPVLLIMRDAPLPPPRIVIHRARALAGRVQLSLEVPYLPQLRMVDDPVEVLQGKGRGIRRLRRTLRTLRDHLYGATFLAAGGASTEPVPHLPLEEATPMAPPQC